jgi:hypothetical protein
MPKSKKVIFGRGMKPKRTRNNYPFAKLKTPGHQFLWPKLKDAKTLRVQASKNGKRRNVVYSVALTEKGILVTLEHFRPPQEGERLTTPGGNT